MTISVAGIDQQRSVEGRTVIATLARAAYAVNVDNGRVSVSVPGRRLRLWVPNPYTHTISGTVTQNGSPVQRLVRLTRRGDASFVREVYSDAGTGAYEFDGLDDSQEYVVRAFDDDTAPDFNALVWDRVVPA